MPHQPSTNERKPNATQRSERTLAANGVQALVHLDSGWVEFSEACGLISTFDPDELSKSLERVEVAVGEGLFAVGFVSFEAAVGFDSTLETHAPADRLPLLEFGLFRTATPIADPAWYPRQHSTESQPWWVSEAESDQSYRRAISRIQRGIAAGDVYQVNYTFPFSVYPPANGGHEESPGSEANPGANAGDGSADGIELLRRLCAAQKGRYACYYRRDEIEVCSGSPELFFQRTGDRITTKPMKGTARRGRFLEEDQELTASLRKSEKDRAENLMIVDMMRNDLGRIADVGSVKVTSLFDVEKLPTLHQMTSTVQARTTASLSEIFRALFPCSSITGAPKITAMQTIRSLEEAARGVYTGAVGVVLPEETTTEVGPSRTRARFNVGIRTAWRTDSRAPFYYGVGSGVVWDSDPEKEHNECVSKAQAIAIDRPDFRLLETMLVLPAASGSGDHKRLAPPLSRIVLFENHLQRLRASAQYFDFAIDETRLHHELATAVDSSSRRTRLRLLLAATGEIEIETQGLTPTGSPDSGTEVRAVNVAMATEPVASSDPFLFHKTTHRTTYEDALQTARERHPDQRIDDVILFNEKGHLTESSVANLVLPPVAPGRRWRTPPRIHGLLAGTLRQALLDSEQLEECPLTVQDLRETGGARLINSVRGVLPIRLVDGD